MANLSGQSTAFAARALRLAERSETRSYHIAMLGEFKRGKSTLVNALIGEAVLPTGVLPVTTVVTEVRFGEGRPGVVVVFEDETRHQVPTTELAHYVSEQGNPGNSLGVRRVEVSVAARLGAQAVVVVDTPGVASVSERQTLAARQALADSDGAVVVMSADSPLSQSEEDLVKDLAARGGRVFFAVNKSDHLTREELAEIRTFLTHRLDQLLGRPTHVYPLSARRALEALTQEGHAPRSGDPGFTAFRRDLETFLRDDLTAERERANAAALGRLASSLSEAVTIERAAATLDLVSLQDRLERFGVAADDVRRAFAADRLLLDHDVVEIGGAVKLALVAGAARAADLAWPSVEQSVEGLHGRALDRALDDAVDAAVIDAFGPLRRVVETTADEGWKRAAARFAERQRQLVHALRTAANDLFEVQLAEVAPATVAEVPERFSFLFLRVESPGSSLARSLRTMVPTERARRAMLQRAHRRLATELDKHAGRARFDAVQRLDAVARTFLAAMTGELEETESSIIEAATRARRALESTKSEQASREADRTQALAVAVETEQLLAERRTVRRSR